MYYTHDELEPCTEIIPCNRLSFTISSRRSRRSHDREDIKTKREKLVTKLPVGKKKNKTPNPIQFIISKISSIAYNILNVCDIIVCNCALRLVADYPRRIGSPCCHCIGTSSRASFPRRPSRPASSSRIPSYRL